jgi:hypothetical protein
VVFLLRSEMEGNFDALNHEYLTLSLYLADRIGVETLEGNLTRCQRAGKGAEQSAAGRRNQVVERRRVRLLVLGRDAIVLSDPAMHPKNTGSSLAGSRARGVRRTASTPKTLLLPAPQSGEHQNARA